MTAKSVSLVPRRNPEEYTNLLLFKVSGPSLFLGLCKSLLNFLLLRTLSGSFFLLHDLLDDLVLLVDGLAEGNVGAAAVIEVDGVGC
jgi:hypothetical protein